ncbi:MAG TPA: hypothetical protein PK156_31330 [Polyangium sp.]|nr:hypothetical protein [Polyangium sp.]
MQRFAHGIALVCFAVSTAACLDQGHHDQTQESIEAARREAARDARLQALEREHAFLMQQLAALSSAPNSAHVTDAKDDERDKKLADISTQIGAMSQMLSAWREEERPKPLDPDAGRIADQGSEAERQAAIRKVQALIDAGRIKLTMRGGRIQIAQVRPIDATNPYEPPPANPVPPKPPTTKQPADRLGF